MAFVYHYCKLSAALSVLRNRQIWMTSIRNLNDSNETIGVYKLFFDRLRKYDKDGRLADLYDFARQPRAIALYGSPLTKNSEYVACFCENPDSVSQWIAYADDGRGFAIGFDEEAFHTVDAAEGIEYRAITYVTEEAIDRCIPSIYETLVRNAGADTPALMNMAMAAIKAQYPIGSSHKTFHYESECEKRFIYNFPTPVTGLAEGWDVKGLEVYAKTDMLNTYVPLQFPKEAVRAIVTGPKYQSSLYELETVLTALGYNVSDIALHKSSSGYR